MSTVPKRKTSSKPRVPILAPGGYVLLGGTQGSYPVHWYLGRVLWADDRDVMVERSTMNGETWRQHCCIGEVRAHAKEIAPLVAIQSTATKAVRELQNTVNEAEGALGRARDALWAKLNELAESGDGFIPPDFDAIEDAHAKDRAAIEASEAESA